MQRIRIFSDHAAPRQPWPAGSAPPSSHAGLLERVCLSQGRAAQQCAPSSNSRALQSKAMTAAHCGADSSQRRAITLVRRSARGHSPPAEPQLPAAGVWHKLHCKTCQRPASQALPVLNPLWHCVVSHSPPKEPPPGGTGLDGARWSVPFGLNAGRRQRDNYSLLQD